MYKINQITVLGSGIMGHGIAQISAMAGYNVNLRDIQQAFLDKAMDKIKWSVNKLVEKQKITQSEAEKIINRIHPIVDLEQSLNDRDIEIEPIIHSKFDKLLVSKQLLVEQISKIEDRKDHIIFFKKFCQEKKN